MTLINQILLLDVMGVGDDIFTIIKSISNAQLQLGNSKGAEILSRIRVVAGIGSLVYIFSSLIVQVAQNNTINFFPLLKPFAVCVLIAYTPTIFSALDNIFDALFTSTTGGNEAMVQRVKNTMESIKNKIDEKWDIIGSDAAIYQAHYGKPMETGLIDDIAVSLEVSYDRNMEKLKWWVLESVQNILMALTFLIEAFYYMVSIIFKTTLRALFPIALVASLFPGMSNNAGRIFGKYIYASLLPFCTAFVSSFVFRLIDTYVNAYDANSAVYNSGGEVQVPEYFGITFIVILIISLMAYSQVFNLASFAIEAGGMASSAQSFAKNIIGTSKTTANAGIAGSKATGQVASSTGGAIAQGGALIAGAVGGAIIGANNGNTIAGAKAGYGAVRSRIDKKG